MYLVHADQWPAEAVTEAGAEGVQIQWLIAAQQGAPHFALRRFTLSPQGHTPRHAHPWEHVVYILRGRGTLITKEGETPLQPDDAVLVLPDEPHSFRAGPEGMQMLCLVPLGEATQGR